MNHLTPPSLPPVDDCIDVMGAIRRGEEGGWGGGERCAIADRLELHMPRDAPFVRGVCGSHPTVGSMPGFAYAHTLLTCPARNEHKKTQRRSGVGLFPSCGKPPGALRDGGLGPPP